MRGGICESVLLFGGRRLLQVPHLERVVLRGGDEDGLDGVERQSADAVEVAPQGELGVPRLSHGVRVVADLRGDASSARHASGKQAAGGSKEPFGNWDDACKLQLERRWNRFHGNIKVSS